MVSFFRAIHFKEEVEPVLPPLQQLLKGLDVRNPVSLIGENPKSFKMCFTVASELSVDDFQNLSETVFKGDEGSNLRDKEINTAMFFESFLDTCQNDSK